MGRIYDTSAPSSAKLKHAQKRPCAKLVWSWSCDHLTQSLQSLQAWLHSNLYMAVGFIFYTVAGKSSTNIKRSQRNALANKEIKIQ